MLFGAPTTTCVSFSATLPGAGANCIFSYIAPRALRRVSSIVRHSFASSLTSRPQDTSFGLSQALALTRLYWRKWVGEAHSDRLASKKRHFVANVISLTVQSHAARTKTTTRGELTCRSNSRTSVRVTSEKNATTAFCHVRPAARTSAPRLPFSRTDNERMDG